MIALVDKGASDFSWELRVLMGQGHDGMGLADRRGGTPHVGMRQSYLIR
jgi:hypothetical protein